jgi:hypothetical protein
MVTVGVIPVPGRAGSSNQTMITLFPQPHHSAGHPLSTPPHVPRGARKRKDNDNSLSR